MKNRQNTVGKHKTSIRSEVGKTFVRYHNTDVVTFDEHSIKLQTGGWMTNTTKLRMNQAANQFGLGFGVYQKNHAWFVVIKNPDYTPENGLPYWTDEKIPFLDGMELCRTHFGRKVDPFIAIVGVPA